MEQHQTNEQTTLKNKLIKFLQEEEKEIKDFVIQFETEKNIEHKIDGHELDDDIPPSSKYFPKNEVEKLAELESQVQGLCTSSQYAIKQSFINGYNKAKETLYTNKQVLEIIKMSRQTKEVEGIKFPIPKYTEQEIIDIINQL